MAASSVSGTNLYTQKAQLGNLRSGSLAASSLSIASTSRLKSIEKKERDDEWNRVLIIVSGTCFETYEATLDRFPNTLLGSKSSRQKFYDTDRECLSFDRNREAFHAILFYYQSYGILACPSDVPIGCFIEEAAFFGIDANHLNFVEEQEEKLPKQKARHPAENLQEAIWLTIEYPNYSKIARVISIFWIISITFGIFVYCLETEKSLHKFLNKHLKFKSSVRQTIHPSGIVSDIWTCFELIVVFLFSLDFLLRFCFTPKKLEYLRSPFGAIDVCAMVPSYIWISLCLIDPSYSPEWFRRGICLSRSLRVLKLIRYSYGVKYVIWVLSKTMRDIPCFNLDMFVCLIFFATLLFNAEHRHNPGNGFDSIPEAIWYVVVSMTTVGYGDVIVTTLQGKLASTACVLIGILLLVSLPTPFFYQKFGNIYTSHEEEQEEDKDEETQDTVSPD